MMALAEFLRQWRKRHDLTQAQAAKWFDMPVRTYQGIEAGRPFRYDEMMRTAADAFTGEPWEARS